MPRVLRAPSPPRTPKNVSIQTPARSQATDDQAVPTTSGDAPDSSSGFGGDVYEQVTVFAHMSAAILLTVAEIRARVSVCAWSQPNRSFAAVSSIRFLRAAAHASFSRGMGDAALARRTGVPATPSATIRRVIQQRSRRMCGSVSLHHHMLWLVLLACSVVADASGTPPPRSNLSCVAFVSLVPHPTIRVVLCWLVPCTWYGGRCSKMLACEDPFFFDTVVPIGPKNDMCHSQRPKVRSEPATCVNVPKIVPMIHPGSTLTNSRERCRAPNSAHRLLFRTLPASSCIHDGRQVACRRQGQARGGWAPDGLARVGLID